LHLSFGFHTIAAHFFCIRFGVRKDGIAMALSDLELRAERARNQLFERYNQLNALWINAEEVIGRFHIPQAVWYEYRIHVEDSGTETGYCLGVSKIEGKWRICHRTYCHLTAKSSDVTPITECSEETRVTTAQHVPELLDQVVTSAEQFIPRVDEAIEAVRGFIDSQGSVADQPSAVNEAA
jgi:hypothetical protein